MTRSSVRIALTVAAVALATPTLNIHAATYQQTVIADGPIRYYPLDDPAGSSSVQDLSTNAVAGIISGGITLAQPTIVSNLNLAIHVDGNSGSFIDLGMLYPGPSFTVEAWSSIDPDCSSDYHAMVGNWDGCFEFSIAGGYGGHWVVRTSPDNVLGELNTSPLGLGQWNHLVGTYDANFVMSYYVNGVLVNQATQPGPLLDGSQYSCFIGATRDGFDGSCQWKGFISQVAIYDYALTPTQVQNHYSAGASGNTPTLDIQSAVILSWPSALAGYFVQTAPTPDGPWTAATNTPYIENGKNMMAIPLGSTQGYYRLKLP